MVSIARGVDPYAPGFEIDSTSAAGIGRGGDPDSRTDIGKRFLI